MANFLSLDSELIKVEVQENANHFCIICKAEFHNRNDRNEHLETHFIHKNCEHCLRPVIIIGDLEFELHRPVHCILTESDLNERCIQTELNETNDEKNVSNLLEEVHRPEPQLVIKSTRRSKPIVNYAELDTMGSYPNINEEKPLPRRKKRTTRHRTMLPLKTEHIDVNAEAVEINDVVSNAKSGGSESEDAVVKEIDVARKKRRKYVRLPKTVPCTECDAMFGSERTLKIHLNQIHGIKEKLVCPICAREFKVSGNLKQHIETHSEHKRFICNYCGKGFHLPYNLKEHMNTHTGARPYKCEICGKTFGRNTLRQAHMRIHTGVKPYKCTEENCDRAYAYQTDLKRHRRSAHGIITKTFPCPICNKVFYENKFLTKHLGVHHGNVRE